MAPAFVELDFASTHALTKEMKFHVDVMTLIVIYGIFTYEDTGRILPHAGGAEKRMVKT